MEMGLEGTEGLISGVTPVTSSSASCFANFPLACTLHAALGLQEGSHFTSVSSRSTEQVEVTQ